MHVPLCDCTELDSFIPLIDLISDTRSQGCTDLQSLVKCLDHRGIVLALDTVYVCNQTRGVLGWTRLFVYSTLPGTIGGLSHEMKHWPHTDCDGV